MNEIKKKLFCNNLYLAINLIDDRHFTCQTVVLIFLNIVVGLFAGSETKSLRDKKG